MKVSDYTVVMATHPQTPNHTRNTRGRVQHLAKSTKQGTLTLCNMLVSFEYPYTSFDKPCAVCSAKLERELKGRQEAMPPEPLSPKYSFTINTDASYTPKYGGVAAYAFWVKSNHYRLTESEAFNEPVANSSVAELLAFERALWALDQLVGSDPYLRDQRDRFGIRVYLNTDSMWTIHALTGKTRNTKHRAVINRVAAIPKYYELVPRHIRSHQRSDGSARWWVNDWCDRHARQELHARLEEINAQV